MRHPLLVEFLTNRRRELIEEIVDTHWWQKRKREKLYQRVKHLDEFHGFLKNCLVQSKTAIENMK